ncbi:hypothetical protein SR70_04910 [Klebsiella aerogenes]|nr:hypothetical protein [Klebsiella aerogenes]KJP43609.1 hypothetical protein SR70_04910 [Klebsiella aerogenes]
MSFLVILSCVTAFSGVANATDAADVAAQHSTKAQAYVACGFYSNLSHMNDHKPSDEHFFLKAGANEFIKSTESLGSVAEREDILIDYASYVASQQALLWDQPGLNDLKTVEQAAKKLYAAANCDLLKEAIK